MHDLAVWAQASPPDDFWVTAGVLILLSVGGFVGAFVFYLRKSIIEDTPTSKIRSAAQGYVELVGRGKLMEGPPIVAPLTGTVCTWFSYRIEERRRTGKNTNWVTVEKGVSDDLFLIQDETGACVIDPEGASVTPHANDVWYGSSQQPMTGPRAGGGGWISFGGRYRYQEERLHPEESLFAIGLFKTVGGAGGDFNVDEDLRELLREWKRHSEALLKIYDKDKDGQLDMEEWQAVREAAYRKVMADYKERKTVMPANVMGRTGDMRRPYLLSAVSQRGLERRFTYYIAGLITLFFLAGASASWLIDLRVSM
ncbi:MAG: GIDE domain-containing protein [Gammaproteobacteria bacterium]|jgi:hypothetical protein